MLWIWFVHHDAPVEESMHDGFCAWEWELALSKTSRPWIIWWFHWARAHAEMRPHEAQIWWVYGSKSCFDILNRLAHWHVSCELFSINAWWIALVFSNFVDIQSIMFMSRETCFVQNILTMTYSMVLTSSSTIMGFWKQNLVGHFRYSCKLGRNLVKLVFHHDAPVQEASMMDCLISLIGFTSVMLVLCRKESARDCNVFSCRALSDHHEVFEPELALTIMVCCNLVGNLGKCHFHHDVPPVQESMHHG